MHAQPISAVDQGRPSLRFLNEVAKEMRLGVVEHFDTPFGDNTAVICLV